MPAIWVSEAVLMLFVWFIAHHYQYWGTIGLLRKTQPEPQSESLSPQIEKKPEKTAKAFRGLTVKPVCTACEHAEELPVMSRVPPPLIKPQKGQPKSVPTGLQFCPDKKCDYYGWINLGNISANGHPNGGPNRQLHCCACGEFFIETTGTFFYRKQYPAETITWAIATPAEGLGIRAVGRVFKVTPETISDWLAEAVAYFEMFNTCMTRNLEVKQVQLDELYTRAGHRWGHPGVSGWRTERSRSD